MSAFGYKQTSGRFICDVRFTPESGHWPNVNTRPFGPGIDSGFVDAKHFQLAVANLAAHSSGVIGSSLIA